MKITLIIIAILIIILLVVFALSGGFAPAKPVIKTAGGEIMVYENMSGNYNQSPKVMSRIYDDLLAHGLETTVGIGYYYDNPKSTQESKLRSEIGEVISQEQLTKLGELGLNYQTKTLPVQEYLIVELPYPNQLAVFIQMIKAYAALSKYSRENGMVVDTPVAEIYDMPNKMIIYRKEIIRNWFTAQEILRLLSKHLKTPKSNLEIIAGHKNKIKIIEVLVN